jgi:hypothetical protein
MFQPTGAAGTAVNAQNDSVKRGSLAGGADIALYVCVPVHRIAAS